MALRRDRAVEPQQGLVLETVDHVACGLLVHEMNVIDVSVAGLGVGRVALEVATEPVFALVSHPGAALALRSGYAHGAALCQLASPNGN